MKPSLKPKTSIQVGDGDGTNYKQKVWCPSPSDQHYTMLDEHLNDDNLGEIKADGFRKVHQAHDRTVFRRYPLTKPDRSFNAGYARIPGFLDELAAEGYHPIDVKGTDMVFRWKAVKP